MFSLVNLTLCFFGSMVCLSVNPVESVIFLILTFCTAAIILFILHVEFLGLLFIIIYVGAIAVLFLFVIMMLNIKVTEEEYLDDEESDNYIFPNFSVAFGAHFFLGCSSLFLYFLIESFVKFIPKWTTSKNLIGMLDNFSGIDVMGQTMFNYFLPCFLLAGLILLVALVGSIVLTLKFNTSEKSQNVHRQLSRTENFITFFK